MENSPLGLLGLFAEVTVVEQTEVTMAMHLTGLTLHWDKGEIQPNNDAG